MTTSDLRRAAHEYAEHGWSVFPCAGKNPALPKRQGGNGFKDATIDHAVIDTMWTRFPEANIGLRTGKGSGVAVLDIDPRHGGTDALSRIETNSGCLPGTLMSQTGSGGLHLLYKWAPGIGCGVNVWGPGLDLRGEGGYVIAPPSVHPDTGERYTWAGADWSVNLPPWPTDHLPVGRDPLDAPRVVIPFPRQAGSGALRGLVKVLLAARPGERTHKLNWAAYRAGEHVAAGRLHLDEVLPALEAAARQIGLSETETSRTIASGLRSAGAA